MHKKKTNYKRKPYKKYKKSYNNRVPRGVGPVAPRTITRLKYNDTIDIGTLLTTGIEEYVFRLNSVFAPDVTGGGHQPYGFDQMALLYNRYRVFRCSWIITCPGVGDRINWCVIPINGAIATIDTTGEFRKISEMPKSVSKSTSYNGGPPAVFKGSVYLPRLGGDKKLEYKTDDRFAAVVTTNPTEVMDLHIAAQNISVSSQNPQFTIVLLFDVEFYDPQVMATS